VYAYHVSSIDCYCFNPLQSTGNYSATSNNMKLLHWPLMGGCYIWYSEEGTERGPSVLITVLLLLCGFNVAIKWLIISVTL